MKPKVIIAGSRDFNQYEQLAHFIDYNLSHDGINDITILSGKASGADKLGEKYALEKGYEVQEYPADWKNLNVKNCKVRKNAWGQEYNSLAGFNRNEEMAKNADILFAFFSDISKKSLGTMDMINRAEKHGLKIYVYPS